MTKQLMCPLCGLETPSGSRFCKECGKSLIIVCSSCNIDSYIWDEFCSNCGQSIYEIEEKIKIAKQKGGGQTELDYSGIFGLSKKDEELTAKLSFDEYVIKAENSDFQYQDKDPTSIMGHLWLTNKRIVYMGKCIEEDAEVDTKNILNSLFSGRQKIFIDYENIKKIEAIEEKKLFSNQMYLYIETKDDELIKFGCDEAEKWINIIQNDGIEVVDEKIKEEDYNKRIDLFVKTKGKLGPVDKAETALLNSPFDLVNKACEYALKNVKAKVKKKKIILDGKHINIKATIGFNFLSAGEKILIDIELINPESTRIYIRSSSKIRTTLADWGKNQNNIDIFKENLFYYLATNDHAYTDISN